LWETTGCIFLKIFFCQKLIFIFSTMAFSNPHSWMKGFVVKENIVILKWKLTAGNLNLSSSFSLCALHLKGYIREEAHHFFCWHLIYTLLWFPPLPFLSLRSSDAMRTSPNLSNVACFLLSSYTVKSIKIKIKIIYFPSTDTIHAFIR
jgi:hypothetical protein